MRKILFFSENFPPEVNAASTRVYERACYWVKWGYDVTVITCAPNFPQGRLYPGYKNKWHQVEFMDGIRVVRVKTFISKNEGVALRTLDFLSYNITAVAAAIFENKPDVAISTSPQFFAAVAGWMVSEARRIPFIFELGDLWPASIAAVGVMKRGNILLKMVEKLELYLYDRAAHVVSLTNSFKEDLVRRGVPEDKITVVINGVDLPRYAPMPKDPELMSTLHLDEKFVVGYIGTQGAAHGLENVIEAAKIINDHSDDICFLFVGTGSEHEKLKAKVEQFNLSSHVLFVPPKPKAEMPKYWSLCDVALIHLKNSPVFKTVIPSKMFEAMGMGLPLLVVSPEGEASAIVQREGCGLWCPAGEPQLFSKNILFLKENPAKLKDFSAKSLDASQRYTRETQAKKMIDVVENVINTPFMTGD
ncbi:MAG: glycosyltransferase family 4 protein [Nitrospirae bacterium]|nr:glycosyltransferase family 4 protein [Nitrospirota bacterium]MBF0533954.1 glycosyltransferase family 4 protein [Nitrospirota bacterium]MBF0616113.1 glycosyltransferase family 4 protein [Nitrospirota bacterium]